MPLCWAVSNAEASKRASKHQSKVPEKDLTGCLQPARGNAYNQAPHLRSRGMNCEHHDILDAVGAEKGSGQWLRAEQRYLEAVLPGARRLRGGCGTARTGCSSASSRRTACWRIPRRARTWTSTSRAKIGAAAPLPRATAPPGTTPRTGAQLPGRWPAVWVAKACNRVISCPLSVKAWGRVYVGLG